MARTRYEYLHSWVTAWDPEWENLDQPPEMEEQMMVVTKQLNRFGYEGWELVNMEPSREPLTPEMLEEVGHAEGNNEHTIQGALDTYSSLGMPEDVLIGFLCTFKRPIE